MFRLSIIGLLAFVGFFGVVTAALIYATDLWANLVFTLLVAALLGGIVACIYCWGASRAYWVGFTLFGWVYAMPGGSRCSMPPESWGRHLVLARGIPSS
jgi:hypothetical protein